MQISDQVVQAKEYSESFLLAHIAYGELIFL